MKRVVVVLHRDLDELTGRNEKIKSRLKLLKKKNWKIGVLVIKEKKGVNNFFRISSNLFRVVTVSLQIALSYEKGEKLVLWTMNAPSYLHVSGILTKIFCNNIKWVAELRDALCEEPFYSRKAPATKLLNRMLEFPLIHKADKVVTIKGSSSLREFYTRNHPQFIHKVEELPYMGFNKEDFEKIPSQNFSKFTITYAGRLYDGWIEPDTFLKGFAKFIKNSNISSDEIQAKFYVKGWKDKHNNLLSNLGIEDYVEVHGFVSKDKIFSILKSSDLLLFINGSNKSRKDMLHTKFYDYLASETPIFLLAEEGFVISDIVEKNNLGFIAKENDPKDVLQVLNRAYNSVDTMIKRRKNIDQLMSRIKHDEIFEKVLEEITRK